ncbi:MAG: GTP-binding protein [bacterium]|nr:GTP-binding protein [bacterium]
MKEKDAVHIVFAGHVDHGKSSLIGRLLYDTESIPPEVIEETKQTAAELNKEWEPAFILDSFREERERGITIDTTQVPFATDKRRYVIIDAPGHVEFTQNMVTGASQAEAAIVLVDASLGLQEQSRRHAYIIGLLGIKQIILVMNKMDLVDYDQKVYDKVVADTKSFLSELSISVEHFIPISAKTGENIAVKSDNMPWYTGPTILEVVDLLIPSPKDDALPFCMPLQDTYKTDGKNVFAGRIEYGAVSNGDKLIAVPENKEVVVKKILLFNEEADRKAAPSSIGLIFEEEENFARGDVLCDPKAGLKITDTLDVLVFWMGDDPLKTGEKITWRLATQSCGCEILEIKERINSSTLEVLTDDMTEMKRLEVGTVTIKSERPFAVKNFNDMPVFGRFVFERDYSICAGGLITEI